LVVLLYQKTAKLEPGFVQLRFGRSYRNAQQPRYFFMLVAFDVVQYENVPIPARQLRDRIFQRDPGILFGLDVPCTA
jgi:hypothetical protein